MGWLDKRNPVAEEMDRRAAGGGFEVFSAKDRTEAAGRLGLGQAQAQTTLDRDGKVDPIGAAITIGMGWPHKK